MAKTSVKSRPEQQTETPRTNGKPKAKDNTTVTVSVPLEELPEGGNRSRMHLDLQLDVVQSNVLRRIQRGLDGARATLDNGRRVTERTDAIRWILEQVNRK